MQNNTNSANTSAMTSNPRGIGFTATTCRGAAVQHSHELPADTIQLQPGLSYEFQAEPVQLRQDAHGNMIRRFGSINYIPATGQMHITQRDGALQSEIGALFATALHPNQDPASWPVHPCHPERRRIALYRPVDEHYLAEAAEVMFDDLQHAEQAQAVAIWAEGFTNA